MEPAPPPAARACLGRGRAATATAAGPVVDAGRGPAPARTGRFGRRLRGARGFGGRGAAVELFAGCHRGRAVAVPDVPPRARQRRRGRGRAVGRAAVPRRGVPRERRGTDAEVDTAVDGLRAALAARDNDEDGEGVHEASWRPVGARAPVHRARCAPPFEHAALGPPYDSRGALHVRRLKGETCPIFFESSLRPASTACPSPPAACGSRRHPRPRQGARAEPGVVLDAGTMGIFDALLGGPKFNASKCKTALRLKGCVGPSPCATRQPRKLDLKREWRCSRA